MDAPGRYSHLSRDQAIELLERRDLQRTYGLVWERDGIEGDRALNDDFVALDLVPELSTAPLDQRGWRNLVIEGDNWDALRALRLAYAGRVKCILIDPPYNTGNKDFTYNDRFVGAQDRYRQSTWLEFLYRRLLLARDLLSEDGVILACINDENRARLDLLMERVFPGMRVGSFVWRTRTAGGGEGGGNMSVDHEHVLVFAGQQFSFRGLAKTFAMYRQSDGRGRWRVASLSIQKNSTERPNSFYPLEDPDTGVAYPCSPDRVWAFVRRKHLRNGVGTSMEDVIADGRVIFPSGQRVGVWETRDALDAAIAAGDVPCSGSGKPLLRSDLPGLDAYVGRKVGWGIPALKLYAEEVASQSQAVSSLIANDAAAEGRNALRAGTNAEGTKELRAIFGDDRFSYPKPRSLFEALVSQATGPGDVVLDFFAGSGTTAHAALALNARDGAGRRFVMVSSTEATSDAPDRNICRDVCAERIRRVLAGGEGGTPGLPGDFAYLRARRIPVEDTAYDLDPAAVWTLLQLRHGRPLLPYDPLAAVQVSPPGEGEGDGATLLFATEPGPAAMERARELARQGDVVVFTPVPGPLRDALGAPALPVEQVPGRLLAEFPRVLAGL